MRLVIGGSIQSASATLHTVSQVSIAKVEPLTTARALRGPFDYRLPAAMEGLEVGSIVRVPFGHRRVLGVVVERAESSELPPERLAEPIEALEAGAPAGAGPARPLGRPRVLLDPLARPRRWCCLPGPAPAASGSARGSSCGPRSPPRARRR